MAHETGSALMQRFTLLHDGSDLGWQAAYLAFHLSARLGAPLLVLLGEPKIDREMIAQRANQLEVGGRAAGLEIRIRPVTDFSVDVVVENAAGSNGLIVPRGLLQDNHVPATFLEKLSCPLWIVARESEMRHMAVLVKDPAADMGLIARSASLSNRLQEPLIGLATQDSIAFLTQSYPACSWHRIADFSPAKIVKVLDQLDINILFLPVSRLSLASEVPVNCVVYPA
jgi:hypothetical protein